MWLFFLLKSDKKKAFTRNNNLFTMGTDASALVKAKKYKNLKYKRHTEEKQM